MEREARFGRRAEMIKFKFGLTVCVFAMACQNPGISIGFDDFLDSTTVSTDDNSDTGPHVDTQKKQETRHGDGYV